MEPTLIPEKRLFLHQGRKVLLPWMSSDTSFGDLTRGSPRHVLAAVEAVEATASRHAAKRLSKVSVLSAPTASRSACLPFSNTPALSVAEGCRERPRHVAQSAPAKVRQIECIWGQPLQQLHLLEKNTNTVRRTVETQGSAFGFDLLCHAIRILESSIIHFKTQTKTKIAYTPM